MACDPKVIAPLLKAFSGYGDWRKMANDEKQEYARRFAAIPKSEYHARQIVDAAVSRIKFLPALAELTELAESMPSQPMSGTQGCDRCEFTGRVSGWYLWTTTFHPSGAPKGHERELIPSDGSACWLLYEPKVKLGKDQVIRICSAFCDCALGQRLKAGALQHRAEAA